MASSHIFPTFDFELANSECPLYAYLMDDSKWERSQELTNGSVDTESVEFATDDRQSLKENGELCSEPPNDVPDPQGPTSECVNPSIINDVGLKNDPNPTSAQSVVPPAAFADAAVPLTRQLSLNSSSSFLPQRVAACNNTRVSSGPVELDGSKHSQEQSSSSGTRAQLVSGCVLQANGLVVGPRARPADGQSIGKYYSTFKTTDNGEVVRRLDRYYCLQCSHQSRGKGDMEKHSKIHGAAALSCRDRGCTCVDRQILFRDKRSLERHLLRFKNSGGSASRKNRRNDENKPPSDQSPKPGGKARHEREE